MNIERSFFSLLLFDYEFNFFRLVSFRKKKIVQKELLSKKIEFTNSDSIIIENTFLKLKEKNYIVQIEDLIKKNSYSK